MNLKKNNKNKSEKEIASNATVNENISEKDT